MTSRTRKTPEGVDVGVGMGGIVMMMDEGRKREDHSI